MDPDNSSQASNKPVPPSRPKGGPANNVSGSSKFMKMIVVGGVVILVFAIVALAISSRHKRSNTSTNNQTSTEALEEGTQQTESQLRDFKHEVTITITAKGVSPQALNAPVNTRINWMNKDKKAHRIAITPGTPVPPQFDDKHQIDVAGGYPYVINTTGTFHYYIVDHPKQGGTFIIK